MHKQHDCLKVLSISCLKAKEEKEKSAKERGKPYDKYDFSRF